MAALGQDFCKRHTHTPWQGVLDKGDGQGAVVSMTLSFQNYSDRFKRLSKRPSGLSNVRGKEVRFGGMCAELRVEFPGGVYFQDSLNTCAVVGDEVGSGCDMFCRAKETRRSEGHREASENF
jgi:hypothetical protein